MRSTPSNTPYCAIFTKTFSSCLRTLPLLPLLYLHSFLRPSTKQWPTYPASKVQMRMPFYSMKNAQRWGSCGFEREISIVGMRSCPAQTAPIISHAKIKNNYNPIARLIITRITNNQCRHRASRRRPYFPATAHSLENTTAY
jgi:hypothetical protein